MWRVSATVRIFRVKWRKRRAKEQARGARGKQAKTQSGLGDMVEFSAKTIDRTLLRRQIPLFASRSHEMHHQSEREVRSAPTT